MKLYSHIIAVLFATGCCLAQQPVRYSVQLIDPGHHLVRITVAIPPGPAEHELQLPVWNALYQVRDFSQYMNWIRAEDATGKPLPLTQLNPSRWKIMNTVNGATVTYEMFSNDPGPFGAELNLHHAFFNLAEILIYAEDLRRSPQQIEFTSVPSGWKIATPLAGDDGAYSALNYDQLVDSPIEISNFTEQDFTGVCGKYRVVLDSPNATPALATMVPPIHRIVDQASRWMNDCPFKTYTFIYHFSDSAGGGMEHANGTAITMRPQSLEGNLAAFEFTTAHEFFHAWDVKRIRPQSLEPVDYTKENDTAALWFSEGVDSTVAQELLLRAGLMDEPQYLKDLSEAITELENAPARLTQSAEQSSLDAWLEKYPYYGLPDRSISYYNKGELLGVLLDLRLREATYDRATLQTLFRWMNDHYAKQGKFFPDSGGVREGAEAVSGADLSQFFRDYVSGTAEIPWNDFFSYVGLHLQSREVVIADRGFDVVQKFDQPAIVVQISPGSDAERAGLQSGDAIARVNGTAVGRESEKDIDALGPGRIVQLRVRRHGKDLDLQFKLGSTRQTIFELEDVPDITAEQKRHRQQWLFGDADSDARSQSKLKLATHWLYAFRLPDAQDTRSTDSP